nr:reverse transcriptase domain-containing protein [Tanacetum cinerariifolium]
MRTRSSSNLPGESPPNPSSSNPKRRNRRRSKQAFILKESPVDTMADQCTMAELLRAPTEGYAEAIVVPPILAEQFEFKHSLINMMTSDKFFGLEKDNPHDHIRWTKPQARVFKILGIPGHTTQKSKTWKIEEASLLTTHLFITTIIYKDKHGLPLTKRLFKVTRLDLTPELIRSWG